MFPLIHTDGVRMKRIFCSVLASVLLVSAKRTFYNFNLTLKSAQLVVLLRVLDIVKVDETAVVESHLVALLSLVQLVHVRWQ